jgi:hypothetical protein
VFYTKDELSMLYELIIWYMYCGSENSSDWKARALNEIEAFSSGLRQWASNNQNHSVSNTTDLGNTAPET